MSVPPVTAGTQMWVDASQEAYSDLALITPVHDWSGNSRDWTATGTGKPEFLKTGGPNGLSAFQFDGVDDFAQVSPFAAAYTSGEVFAVLKRNSTSNAGVWSWGDDDGNPQFYPFGVTLAYEVFGSSVRQGPMTHGITITNYHLLNVLSQSGLLEARWNGGGASNEAQFSTVTNTVKFTAVDDGAYFIGKPRSGGTPGDCAISEIIMFNRVLSVTERNKMGGYFQTKTGITIANATFPPPTVPNSRLGLGLSIGL